VAIPLNPRRQGKKVERQLGATRPGRANWGFEATLVTTQGEAPRVRLKQLGWGIGVGWYAERSVELELDQAKQIAALLNQAARTESAATEGQEGPLDSTPNERQPIDFAAARARRRSGRKRSRRPASGAAGTAPTPIRPHQGAESPDEESPGR
jgi:hypothetical protein